MKTDNVSDVTFYAPEKSPRRRNPLTPPARPVCAIGTYFLDTPRIWLCNKNNVILDEIIVILSISLALRTIVVAVVVVGGGGGGRGGGLYNSAGRWLCQEYNKT
jgi:hypothetical protein